MVVIRGVGMATSTSIRHTLGEELKLLEGKLGTLEQKLPHDRMIRPEWGGGHKEVGPPRVGQIGEARLGV